MVDILGRAKCAGIPEELNSFPTNLLRKKNPLFYRQLDAERNKRI
jgi:hypothetical protein